MNTTAKKNEQLKKGQIIGAIGFALFIIPFLIKKSEINPSLSFILALILLLFGACFLICRGLLIIYSDVLRINFLIFEGQGIPGFIKNLVGYGFVLLGGIAALVALMMMMALPF